MPVKILVTLDGSAMSEAVLQPALDLAAQCHAEVLLYSVLNKPDLPYLSLLPDRSGLPPPARETVVEAENRLRREIEDMLSEKVAEFTARELLATAESGFGSPAELIVELAERWKPDLIAMATHGRSGIAEQLMGSVSSKVLRSGVAPLFLVYSPVKK
jgi:nucleotide-binding universal stress UspA family protein